MGSMRQRSPGTWQLIVDLPRGPDGKRRTRAVTVTGRKQDAKLELARLELEAKGAAPLTAATLTVAEFLDRWLEEMEPGWAASTASRARLAVRRYLAPGIGPVKLQQLTALHVSGLYRQLLRAGRQDGGGLAPGSVRTAHQVLRNALGKAVEWDLIARNVCQSVALPKAPPAADTAVTREEVERLLQAAGETELRLVILLAIGTGMRRGELAALQWSAIAERVVRVDWAAEPLGKEGEVKEPKGKRRRALTVPRSLAAALEAQRAAQDAARRLLGSAWQENGLVLTQGDGRPIPPAMLSDWFRRLAARAGVPHVTLHGLRHGHASWLVEEGVDIYTISRRLGHASAAFTLARYVHQVGAGDERAADRLDEAIREMG